MMCMEIYDKYYNIPKKCQFYGDFEEEQSALYLHMQPKGSVWKEDKSLMRSCQNKQTQWVCVDSPSHSDDHFLPLRHCFLCVSSYRLAIIILSSISTILLC